MDASSKGSNFIWTKANMKILIDVCLQYRQKYGRNQKFQWPHILKDFEKVSGKKANQNSMKNKYDNMKKEYSSWKLLLQSETGLGWNASTRTITVDDAWWDKKIKENHNCKKYRTNPLPADIEDWWAQLFGDNVATGEYAAAPSMDPIEGIEDEEDGVAQEQMADSLKEYSLADLYHMMNQGIEQAPTQAPPPTQNTQAPAPTQNTQGLARTNSKKNQKLMKRKKRQSEGSLKLAQHLERVEATSSRALDMIGSVTSASVNQHNASEDQLVEALRLLDKMVDEGYLTLASPMWCFAAEKITDDKSRVLFLKMRDDATRLAWIQWAYAKQG